MLRTHIPISNIYQCSGQYPHHVLQKAISMESHVDVVSLLDYIHIVYGSDRGFLHLIVATKRSEIMLSDKIRCSLFHHIHIKCTALRHTPHIISVKYRFLSTYIQRVFVDFTGCIQPCMKPVPGHSNIKRADIRRQISVQIIFYLFRSLICF